MKKSVLTYLIASLLTHSLPAIADSDGRGGGGGGGGGGGAGVAIGIAAVVGLVALLAGSDKKADLVKAADPFAAEPAPSGPAPSPSREPGAQPAGAEEGGIGVNRQLRY